MMMGGRTLISSDSAVPMRSFPVRLPGSRVISSACRTASSTASAQGSSLLPGLGQLDALANSLKQLGVQLRLQLLDLHGDCGLGIAQLLGRFGEILQLRNPHKGYDISDFHILTHQKN